MSREYSLIKYSDLFNAHWFSNFYSLSNDIDPISYFLDNAIKLGLNPNSNFDTLWYLDKYRDVKKSGMNPFVHYILYGQSEGRFPNKFDCYKNEDVESDKYGLNRNILCYSDFFDEEFYLNNYPDVKNSDLTALEHYVKFGFNESLRSPNGIFSNLFYKNKYLHGKYKNWNPLTHYELFGQFKNYKVNIFDINYFNFQNDEILDALNRSISIVIPLSEEIINLEQCINSIKKYTKLNYDIFIVNLNEINLTNLDGENITIINSNSDLDQIFDMNQDVVFLSSDSEVTPKWLEKLIIKAYSNDEIDMVTPLSNNFGSISPDEYTSSNTLTVIGLSKLIEKSYYGIDLCILEKNDSCTFVKKDFLNGIRFDNKENDFKVMNDKFINVLDDSTYIHNKKNNVAKNNLRLLENQISDSTNYINAYALANRILFIVDENDLRFTNDFLLYYLHQNFDCYILTVNTNNVYLWKSTFIKPIKLKKWDIDSKNIYLNILTSIKPDLIQINTTNNIDEKFIQLSDLLNIPLITSSDKCYSFSNLPGIIKENIDLNDFDYLIELRNSLTNQINNKFRILLTGEHIDFSKLFKNDNIFEFIFLEDYIDVSQNISYPHLLQIINGISPDAIFISSFSQQLFSLIDVCQNNFIPLFTLSNQIFEYFDNCNGVDYISLENKLDLNKFSIKYYSLFKELNLNNPHVLKDISNLTRKYENIYFKILDKSPKLFEQKLNLRKDVIFKDFNEFLKYSYFNPYHDISVFENDELLKSFNKIIIDLENHIAKIDNKPLISVIIPVYNRKDIVSFAIDSVLNQTYENFELIIVDDCSDDGTKNLLKTIENNKISIIYHEKNKGAAAARNTGLKHAKGEYIAYLDSDNEWNPKYLEIMISAFLKLDADALYCGQVLYETRNSNPFGIRFGTYNKSLLHNRNYIDLNCFCHKYSIFDELDGFNQNLDRLIDWEFILRVSIHYKMYSIPVLLSKYFYFNTSDRISFSSINLSNYNDNIIKSNSMLLDANFKLKNNVNVLLKDYTSLTILRKCIDKIISFKSDEINIQIMNTKNIEAITVYLNQLTNSHVEPIDNINQIDISSDLLVLSGNMVIEENSIENMQMNCLHLKNCGIIVPQKITSGIHSNINLHVPFANPFYPCDTIPSFNLKNISNINKFHDGNLLELTSIDESAFYINRKVLKNLNLNEFKNKGSITNHVKNDLKLKIYQISDAIVYSIDEGNKLYSLNKFKNN